MFFPESQVRVWLYARPTDMRKSFDGLSALVKNTLREDPLSGHLFVFINRKRSQADLLASLGKESAESTPPAPETISYERRKSGKSRDGAVTDAGLRFDDTVPVETIELPLPPESAAIPGGTSNRR